MTHVAHVTHVAHAQGGIGSEADGKAGCDSIVEAYVSLLDPDLDPGSEGGGRGAEGNRISPARVHAISLLVEACMATGCGRGGGVIAQKPNDKIGCKTTTGPGNVPLSTNDSETGDGSAAASDRITHRGTAASDRVTHRGTAASDRVTHRGGTADVQVEQYQATVEQYDSRARNALQILAGWLGLTPRQLNGLERMHASQVGVEVCRQVWR